MSPRISIKVTRDLEVTEDGRGCGANCAFIIPTPNPLGYRCALFRVLLKKGSNGWIIRAANLARCDECLDATKDDV